MIINQYQCLVNLLAAFQCHVIFFFCIFPDLVPSVVTAPTATVKKALPNGLTVNSNGLNGLNGLTKAHNQPIAINLSTTDGISPALLNASNAAAAIPINLNINAMHQPISNGINGKISSSQPNGIKNANTNDGLVIAKEQIKKSNELSEPPAKVIKLINGNGITLASVDKDNKLLQSGLTLSSVVVNAIPLSTQTLRVFGQTPNGMATIELSNSNRKFRLNNIFFENRAQACNACSNEMLQNFCLQKLKDVIKVNRSTHYRMAPMVPICTNCS